MGKKRVMSIVAALVAGLGLGHAAITARRARPDVVAYVNGKWFAGGAFTPGTRYVADGRFVDAPADGAARAVDLAGKFVVPPFGEAHNHNSTRAMLSRFFEQGIFYVKNPNSFPADRDRAAPFINRPDGPDVVFANGGITSPGGHPISIIDRGISRGTMTAADGDGAFYFAVSNAADLERRWPMILAGHPDFVKIYLLFSERYPAAINDPAMRGWRGLDPTLVPAVVARAHAAGLRVTAHVESAFDFNVAVDAGVDEVTHLPGFRGPAPGMAFDVARFAVTPSMAQKAAARGTVVVTTVSGVEELPADSPMRQGAEHLYRDSLRALHDAGVSIAIGSDRYEFTSRDEALYLSRLGVFDHATLLTLWCSDTAHTIFPSRRVGRIETGAEASFLVLDGDPIADFSAVTRIAMRVKQGVVAAR